MFSSRFTSLIFIIYTKHRWRWFVGMWYTKNVPPR